MKTSTLYMINLLASAFYLIAQQFFSELTNNIILFLVVVLFFYTSEKIKTLNNNAYSMSRLFIALSSVALILFIFTQPVNVFLYSLSLILVVLILEGYE